MGQGRNGRGIGDKERDRRKEGGLVNWGDTNYGGMKRNCVSRGIG